MTATIATRQVKDGSGNLFLQRVLDASGTGAGPFLPANVLANPDGDAPVDVEALFGSLADALAALQAGTVIAAGDNVVGKVGLRLGDADVAAANPLPTRLGGADFQASGAIPVAGSVSAAGTTAAFSPKAGRAAYLWLSGGTSAQGWIEISDDGATWYQLAVEGAALGTFAYVAAAANQCIPLPPHEQAGIQLRVRFAAVSGTVALGLAQ